LLSKELSELKARLWDETKAQGDRLASRWTKVELKGERPMADEVFGEA